MNAFLARFLASILLLLAAPAMADDRPNLGEQYNQAIGTALQAGGESFNQFGTQTFRTSYNAGNFADFTSLSAPDRKLIAQGWRRNFKNLNRATGNLSRSVPFRFAPWALLGAEALPDVVGRAAGGDYQGATAGAGALAVGEAFVYGATVASGLAGSAIGATIGSSLPVVGTAVGECIGGAVGKMPVGSSPRLPTIS